MDSIIKTGNHVWRLDVTWFNNDLTIKHGIWAIQMDIQQIWKFALGSRPVLTLQSYSIVYLYHVYGSIPKALGIRNDGTKLISIAFRRTSSACNRDTASLLLASILIVQQLGAPTSSTVTKLYSVDGAFSSMMFLSKQCSVSLPECYCG